MRSTVAPQTNSSSSKAAGGSQAMCCRTRKVAIDGSLVAGRAPHMRRHGAGARRRAARTACRAARAAPSPPQAAPYLRSPPVSWLRCPCARGQPPYCAWQLASLDGSVPAAAMHEVSFEALLSCWLTCLPAEPVTPLVLSCFLAWLMTCWLCCMPVLIAWLAVSVLGLMTVKKTTRKIAREAAMPIAHRRQLPVTRTMMFLLDEVSECQLPAAVAVASWPP